MGETRWAAEHSEPFELCSFFISRWSSYLRGPLGYLGNLRGRLCAKGLTYVRSGQLPTRYSISAEGLRALEKFRKVKRKRDINVQISAVAEPEQDVSESAYSVHYRLIMLPMASRIPERITGKTRNI